MYILLIGMRSTLEQVAKRIANVLCFRPLFDLRSELPSLRSVPEAVPIEALHSSNQALHRKHSQIFVH